MTGKNLKKIIIFVKRRKCYKQKLPLQKHRLLNKLGYTVNCNEQNKLITEFLQEKLINLPKNPQITG